MLMKRSFALRTLVALLVIAAAVMSRAQTVISGSLSNFDFWNYTGVTANDFELTLDGVTPAQLSGFYTGHYPNVTVTQVGTSTVIRWTGSTTPNGGFAHFGVNLVGVNMAISPIRVKFNWSLNGAPIGTLPSAWQYWEVDLSTGQFVRRDIIANPGPGPIRVQRRVAISLAPSMDLNDLMRGGSLWNQGIIIDPQPVVIPAGGRLSYDFIMPNSSAFAVMMYDMWGPGTSGPLIGTFLNATNANSSVALKLKDPAKPKDSKVAAKAAPKAPTKKVSAKRIKA